jgi:hypothetical protein
VVRHKDFGAPASSDEPITFNLYGETFRCQPAIQGTALLRFISKAGSDDANESADSVLEFLHLAIAPTDRERFAALTTSDETVVPLESLASIMEWLVEQYSGRPTVPSSPSEPGDTTTGPMPVAVPSYPEPLSAS